MTDITKYQNVSLRKETHAKCVNLSEKILPAGQPLSIAHTVDICVDFVNKYGFEKKSASAILDSNWTRTKKSLVKIVVWYDNEWGYSSRVIDLAKKINK